MMSTEKTAGNGRQTEVLFRRTVNQTLKSNDLPDLDEQERLEEAEEREIQEGIPSDIFDYCHDLMERNGESFSYDIHKNQAFVAKKPHPYSWEDVQREFGEGHFRVIARSERTRRYVKQQTQFIGKNPSVSNVNEKENIAEVVRQAMPPAVDPFDNIAKMATLLKSLTPAPAQDQTPMMMMEFMKTMMTVQTEAQKANVELIKEISKTSQEMMNRMDENQRKMIEKLESKITSKPDKAFDPLELLKLVQSAERRGLENYMLLEEMAEKKAARDGGGSSGGDDEETGTSKLIKSIIPMIGTALAKTPVQAAPIPQRQAMARPPIPARPAPRPAAAPIPAAKPVQTVVQAPAQAVKPTVVGTPIASEAITSPKVAQAKAPIPTATIGKPVPRPAVKKEPTKDEMLNLVMPALLPHLMKADEVQLEPTKLNATKIDAASETREIVKKIGGNVSLLLKNFSRDEMLNIAKGVGLPMHANVWLEDYYAHLETFAEQENSSGNEKPQNS